MPEPAVLWLFVDSMVFALAVITLDTLLGLDRPRVEEPGRNRRLWSVMERLPATRRNALTENTRLWEVYDKFGRFEVEIAVSRTPSRASGASATGCRTAPRGSSRRCPHPPSSGRCSSSWAHVRAAGADAGGPSRAARSGVGDGAREAPELSSIVETRFEVARHAGAGQIDHTIEAYDAARLADVLRLLDGVAGVAVPAIESGLSTDRVIVHGGRGRHQGHAGRPARCVGGSRGGGADPLRALIRQVLVEGSFHGDPHSANVLLEPATSQVVFLDLGLMGELGEQARLDLLALVWALRTRDPGMMASVVRRLCRPTGRVDEAAFRPAVERLFSQPGVRPRAR